MMFGLWKKTEIIVPKVDLHSHLIPGIDDGVQTIEQSLELLKVFQSLGYEKVITTPHIMADYYPNTPQIIQQGLKKVQSAAKEAGLTLEIGAAAEYHLDDGFLETLESDEPLLTIGENYLLIETGFQDKPIFLDQAIFKVQMKGYIPILAHPERYVYLAADRTLAESLRNSGVHFQLNLNSLGGYYDTGARKSAERMIDAGMIDFVGSDCHHERHVLAMQKAVKTKYYRKLMQLPLKNDTLL